MSRKTCFLFFILLISAGSALFSQYIPKGMSYQAVARDEKGYELKNKDLQVRICIIPDDPSGISEYSEIHSVVTDKFGLFSISIGQGTYVEGVATDFSKINWGSSMHYLRVAVDFGTGYKNMGTTQFLAVPYALYAASAANAPEAKDEQQLSYNPQTNKLSLENGGVADLSGLANRMQYLGWDGNTLSLSDGNSITLSDLKEDADHDTLNEIQDLHLDPTTNILTITDNNEASRISLVKFLDDTDKQILYSAGDSIGISNTNKIVFDNSKTNEIQNLGKSGDSITLSMSNVKIFDRYEDADSNPGNELQSVRLTGDALSLTNDPDPEPFSLKKYYDNTDRQNLSISNYRLSIDSGNVVNIRPKIIAFRAISVGSSISVSPKGSATLIFEIEKFDSTNVYNTFNNGAFIVPSGGEGLYNFNVLYEFGSNQTIEVFINGTSYEQIPTVAYPYPFIVFLKETDTVEIVLKNTNSVNPIFPQSGMFSGYRVH